MKQNYTRNPWEKILASFSAERNSMKRQYWNFRNLCIAVVWPKDTIICRYDIKWYLKITVKYINLAKGKFFKAENARQVVPFEEQN